jgi:SAM-dependent methyltransferase
MSSGAAHLRTMRAEELKAVLPLLPAAPCRILEIGGGDGYQASVLSSIGYQVESIDVAPSGAVQPLFDVKIYDGQTIPFGGSAFDCVFSSNVLEHIRDLETTNAEIRRVLKPGGVAVHVVPSTAWRLWTNVAHYPYILKVLVTGKHSLPTHASLPTAGETLRRRGLLGTIRRALIPQPHGEYYSSLTELYAFSEGRWTSVFRKHGFDVVEVRPSGIFCTGYGLLGGPMSVAGRRRLARVLGSATHVFVLRARPAERLVPADGLR